MLMAGKYVTQPGDQLQQLSVDRMFKGLTNPDGPLVSLIQQLRAMKSMNPDAYRKAKTQLPYVVCGNFSPAVRRKENFAWLDHFIIDIDHLTSRELTPEGLKRLLKNDDRVVLLFTSPGNDGLKALFRLKERIHDAGYYRVFYKLFAARLAAVHGLQGLVDLVTNDVSRCCFMSYDPDAWYNPQALPVDAATYVSPDHIDNLPELQIEIKKAAETPPPQVDKSASPSLAEDVLWQIKQRLNPALAGRLPKTKNYIQPVELEEVIPALSKALADLGMPIVETTPIDYAKRLKIAAGNLWAEVNLFYGKGRFTPVPTTKTGGNGQLAAMAVQAIQLFFDNRNKIPVELCPDQSG